MSGDTLTDKMYALIILVWLKNIVLDVRQSLIFFRNPIMDIPIYVGHVMPRKLGNIELPQLVGKLHLKLPITTIEKIVKKYMLGIWQDVTSKVQLIVLRVLAKEKLTLTTLTIRDHWKSSGYVDSATLPFIGEIG